MTRLFVWVFLGLSAIAMGAPPQGIAATTDWPGHGGPADEADYSPLTQITAANIGKLGLAWSLDLPGEQMLEATPLAVDGVLYFTGSLATVYAVDAVSGKLLWTYDPEIWRRNPNKMHFIFAANRGVAYADGRVFVGTMDSRLIALDAKTGKVVWGVDTSPPDSRYTITGAPRTFKGKVIIGNGGADMGVRGYVTAYDAATGHEAWRFYVAPGSPDENRGDPAMERAAATWRGDYWKTGTGGGPWDSLTFDPELNRIYIGTGNAAPYDSDVRSPGGGDNLYTAAIVAIDADTGKYVWHYQVNPRDSWDYDCTQQMTLAALTIDGTPHKVVMQAPKNGFFYVIDRVTGKLISAAKIGKATWATRIDVATGRPVEIDNVRYEKGEIEIWPAPFGVHSWQSMSFSPQTGLAYVPIMQVGTRFAKVPGNPGAVVRDVVLADDRDGKGSLVAWDPVTQKPRWRIDHDWMWNGGTMSTAGGLVFQGTADGYFTAYDGQTGKRLWRFNAGLGIIAAPISFAVGGRQYVSVLVGYGGSNTYGHGIMNVGWKYNAQPRRLLTFALNATAALPPTAPPDRTVHPVDDPAITFAQADVTPGQTLFATNCQACHGKDLDSAGPPAPDLRESTVAMDRDALWAVLHDGTLLSRGMPRFETLDAAQVRQIHAYVRAKARDALAAIKSSNASDR